jgi:uncharacterized membrane protein
MTLNFVLALSYLVRFNLIEKENFYKIESYTLCYKDIDIVTIRAVGKDVLSVALSNTKHFYENLVKEQ